MAETDYSQVPVEKLVELFSRSAYTLDGLWFTLLEERYGYDVALDIDIEVWRKFSLIHGKRLLQTFTINEDNPLQAIVRLLRVDPFMFIYKPQIVVLTDSKAVLRCTDCPPQKARIKDGRGEFSCKPVGTALLNSYTAAVDPRIKLSCLVCPPDAHPPEYWCEWQFEI
ncbi:DUF6125 family protein [Chloroflexota bacterium]